MKAVYSVLGATGSVGMQALDVIAEEGVSVDLLVAGRDSAAMEAAARRVSPRIAVMADEATAKDLSLRLADTGIRVAGGREAILDAIRSSKSTVTVNAILGCAGLEPTLAVIASGQRLALANKESLVVAGDIVMKEAKDAGVEILPVDSEHSAIYQSLRSGRPSEVRRLILTASGGPFRGKSAEELRHVTVEDTLAHPTWRMGKKITVDSATMMNKGFEVIEAAHLFGVPVDRIDVVVHPESILHSAVEYIDNAVIGEFSVPDMRMCVRYALHDPDRAPSTGARLDLPTVGRMTFMEPDGEAFPLLPHARRMKAAGGAMPAVMNAADEVAVAAFLAGKIPFYRIADVVIATCDRMASASSVGTLEGIFAADAEARRVADELAN